MAFLNYLEFVGLRNGELFDPDFFSTYFSDAKEYAEFVLGFSDGPPDGFDKYTLD